MIPTIKGGEAPRRQLGARFTPAIVRANAPARTHNPGNADGQVNRFGPWSKCAYRFRFRYRSASPEAMRDIAAAQPMPRIIRQLIGSRPPHRDRLAAHIEPVRPCAEGVYARVLYAD